MGTFGLVFPGDSLTPSTWSGTPAGIAAGLRALGMRAEAVSSAPPAWLNESVVAALSVPMLRRPRAGLRDELAAAREAARYTPAMSALQTRFLGRRLRTARGLDALVQIGTGSVIESGLPVATFEDMTIAQVLEGDLYPGWGRLSRRAQRRQLDQQRRAYERATVCCAATRWAADSIVRDYDVDPAKVHVIGLGRNHTPRVVERNWSAPRFLFVGLDWERKNGPAVLRAFAALRAEQPNARIDLVGGHPVVDAPGVTGHGVLRLGVDVERDRLARLFETATCFVMPSKCEAAGLVYVEAGVSGLPSIGTSIGGAADMIGTGGVVVDPFDDHALLAAMRSLADPATAQRTGANAAEHAASFTWELVAERLVAALGMCDPPVTLPLAAARS